LEALMSGLIEENITKPSRTIVGLSGVTRNVNDQGHILGDDGAQMKDGNGNLLSLGNDGVYSQDGRRLYGLDGDRVVNLPKTDYTAPNLEGLQGATSWNPGDDAMVEKRMTNMLKSDNEYMQRARVSGLQQANSRGLLNSTMGVQAGEAAAMDKAFDVASRDAATMADAGKFNAEQANNFARDANNFLRNWAMQKDHQGWQTEENRSQRTWQTNERKAQNDWQSEENARRRAFEDEQRKANEAFTSGENKLSRDLQERLAKDNQDFNRAAARDERAAGVVTAYYREVQSILRDPNLDEAAKNSQIEALVRNTKATLDMLGVGDLVNTDTLLNFAKPDPSAPAAKSAESKRADEINASRRTITEADAATYWRTYFEDNPDVEAYYKKNLNEFSSPEEAMLWHWNEYGRKEGRALRAPGSSSSSSSGTSGTSGGSGASGSPSSAPPTTASAPPTPTAGGYSDTPASPKPNGRNWDWDGYRWVEAWDGN
jgi:hypothetical protein